eukprot:1206511-Prymnesium_polylepis.2
MSNPRTRLARGGPAQGERLGQGTRQAGVGDRGSCRAVPPDTGRWCWFLVVVMFVRSTVGAEVTKAFQGGCLSAQATEPRRMERDKGWGGDFVFEKSQLCKSDWLVAERTARITYVQLYETRWARASGTRCTDRRYD